MCRLGLEDIDEVGGNNPSRFTFVDGSTENLEFFATAREFPWDLDEPNDSTGNQHCVRYVATLDLPQVVFMFY